MNSSSVQWATVQLFPPPTPPCRRPRRRPLCCCQRVDILAMSMELKNVTSVHSGGGNGGGNLTVFCPFANMFRSDCVEPTTNPGERTAANTVYWRRSEQNVFFPCTPDTSPLGMHHSAALVARTKTRRVAKYLCNFFGNCDS